MTYERCAVFSFAVIEGDPAPVSLRIHQITMYAALCSRTLRRWGMVQHELSFRCVMPNDREPPRTMTPFTGM
ncbi:hypothetical protein QQF64_020447 [Cirrhinus molitorella]|uniref:Uncharacterized protein n=1 Tax=Cirrhinus molitorella TaxID=172907 RepID=A0ABR3L9C1_9TELE